MKSITVVAAVVEWGGKILCMQRGLSPYVYTSYHWEFPGGKIEPGESPQQALHRELLEELAMDVEVGQHISTISHSYPDFHITLMFYHCTPKCAHDVAINPCNDTNNYPKLVLLEHNDYCWLRPDQLHSLSWCPADLPVLPLIKLLNPAVESVL